MVEEGGERRTRIFQVKDRIGKVESNPGALAKREGERERGGGEGWLASLPRERASELPHPRARVIS